MAEGKDKLSTAWGKAVLWAAQRVVDRLWTAWTAPVPREDGTVWLVSFSNIEQGVMVGPYEFDGLPTMDDARFVDLLRKTGGPAQAMNSLNRSDARHWNGREWLPGLLTAGVRRVR